MIIRQLKQKQYEQLHNDLLRKAHTKPLEASYTVIMKINGTEYSLKIQPEPHCRMAVLQACRVCRDEYSPDFELITNGNILLSLLELLIYQGVK